MSAGERPRRVAEQIQRYLSSSLIPGLRDPRLGFATVTGVEVTRDLKTARVFVTIYEPDAAKRQAALGALNGAAGHFRRDLGRGLRLRFAPVLTFHEDTSIERGDRIERLLHEIHEHDADAGGHPGEVDAERNEGDEAGELDDDESTGEDDEGDEPGELDDDEGAGEDNEGDEPGELDDDEGAGEDDESDEAPTDDDDDGEE